MTIQNSPEEHRVSEGRKRARIAIPVIVLELVLWVAVLVHNGPGPAALLVWPYGCIIIYLAMYITTPWKAAGGRS